MSSSKIAKKPSNLLASWSYSPEHGTYAMLGAHKHQEISYRSPDHHHLEVTLTGWSRVDHKNKNIEVYSYQDYNPFATRAGEEREHPQEVYNHLRNFYKLPNYGHVNLNQLFNIQDQGKKKFSERPSRNPSDYTESIQMTPWDKTLAAFNAGKYSSDPSTRAYWRSGEMVPIHELLPYREYNRKTNEKYPGHFNDVKAHIEQNGITDMGILSYNPQTHRVYQSEGNTRLAVAQELGFTHVPVRVYRFHHEKSVGGVAPQPHQFQGHIPQDIKPSQIGFTSMYPSDNVLECLIQEVDDILDYTPHFVEFVAIPQPRPQWAANVRAMIEKIMEGNFDWSELERLYGREFPHSQNHTGVATGPNLSDFHEVADHHGYQRIGDVEGNVMYLHPDNHGLDIHKSGSWVHVPANSTHEEDAVWGDGFSDLKNHLQSFHRSW